METIPPIPEKWAVWRYDKNYKDVNDYFNWLYGPLTLIYKDQSYIHFPKLVDGSSMHSHLQEGYTEITPGQFRRYILPIMEERMDKLEVGDVITKHPKEVRYYLKNGNIYELASYYSSQALNKRIVKTIQDEYFQLVHDNTTWFRIADFVKPGYIPNTQTKQTPIMNTEKPVSRYRTKVDLPDIKAGTEGIYEKESNTYRFSTVNEIYSHRWYSIEAIKNTQFFEPVADIKTIEVGNPKVQVSVKGDIILAKTRTKGIKTNTEELEKVVWFLNQILAKIDVYSLRVKTVHIGCVEDGVEVSLEELNNILQLSGQ